MKLCRVTENTYNGQHCYIVGTNYFADPQENYSIARSVVDMIALQNDPWKRPLIKTPEEYLRNCIK